MASVLKAVFGGDAMPFISELRKMEAAAAVSAGKVMRSFDSTVLKQKAPGNPAAEYASFWKQALAERDAAETTAAVNQASRDNRARGLQRQRRDERIQGWRSELAAMRGAGAGDFQTGAIAPAGGAGRLNWRQRMGVAGSMFTSVARDSAASLASGAPITQVIAQQAPQVLQALAMMKAGTLAWVAVLAGAGLFTWHKLTQEIGKAVFGVNKLAGSIEYYTKRAEDFLRIRREFAAGDDARDKNLLEAMQRTSGELALQNEMLDVETQRKILAAQRQNIQDQMTGKAKDDLAFQFQSLKIQKEALEKQRDAVSDPEGDAKIKELDMAEKKTRQELAEAKAELGAYEDDPKLYAANKDKVNQLRMEIPGYEGDLEGIAASRTAEVEASKKRKSVKVGEFENRIMSLDNQMQAMAIPNAMKPEKFRQAGSGNASGLERHGLFGVGHNASLDVQKNQYSVLLEIRNDIRKQSNQPTRRRGVSFGGRS